MADHEALALDYIDQADEARARLDDLYRVPSEARDGRGVARLNTDLGEALKLADLHSKLAIVGALHDIRQAIEVGP